MLSSYNKHGHPSSPRTGRPRGRTVSRGILYNHHVDLRRGASSRASGDARSHRISRRYHAMGTTRGRRAKPSPEQWLGPTLQNLGQEEEAAVYPPQEFMPFSWQPNARSGRANDPEKDVPSPTDIDASEGRGKALKGIAPLKPAGASTDNRDSTMRPLGGRPGSLPTAGTQDKTQHHRGARQPEALVISWVEQESEGKRLPRGHRKRPNFLKEIPGRQALKTVCQRRALAPVREASTASIGTEHLRQTD